MKDRGSIEILGRQPVTEALSSGWPVQGVILRRGSQDAPLREITSAAGNVSVPVSFMEPGPFDRKYGRRAQGMVAVVKEIPSRNPVDVLRSIPSGEAPFFVALDGIEDPHNLGAITRTALAMGVHGVVVPKHRSAAIGEGVAKASAGAVFSQPICQVPNIHQFVEWSKREGMWVYGLDAKADSDIWHTDLSGPSVLVVGGEEKGLSRLVRERCDFIVKIPMFGRIDSLNASVACAIAICERRRQIEERPAKPHNGVT